MVEELLVPMYRWFQYGVKYAEAPNLDIGALVFRHCAAEKNNGPYNDLAKHFVKFLCQDPDLIEKGMLHNEDPDPRAGPTGKGKG